MTQPLQITIAQINPVVGNLPANQDKILQTLDNLPDETDLVVFPEMVTSGYPPEDLLIKDMFLDGLKNVVSAVQDKSKKMSAYIALPSAWIECDALYNAILIIHKGEIKQIIKKFELPNYGVFDEKRYFEIGDFSEPVIIKDVSIGFMICEDLWFPAVSAHLEDEGAELLVCCNASPFDHLKPEQRQATAKDRVREVGLPVLYVNQVGGQDELVFDGGSFIMDHKGHIVTQLPYFKEDHLHTKWKTQSDGGSNLICETKQIPGGQTAPERLYSAAVLGLRDYVEKNGFHGVLIGLSGGIDSALTAAIATDALGADKVQCIMMPYKYTSDESLEDAQSVAKALKVQYDTINIHDIVDSFANTIRPAMPIEGIALENIQSRSRAVTLMALSNASGKMLVSTGNKSEMAVGYATLYGDMCGGFNPLKDLYKTQVFALCRWRNTRKPNIGKGPEKIIFSDRLLDKAPSAELREDQRDEDSLPPYDVLDDILTYIIERESSLKDIVKAGHDEALVKKIWGMLDRAEYKRRQAPPGVKMTARAFGKERRYPITNGFVKTIEKS